MRGPDILISQTDGKLHAAPIPAQWILHGEPAARNRILSRSGDGTATTVVWDCTAGSFNWLYQSEETVHILEGTATLTFGATVQVISPGSVVVFPAGSHARWDVDSYIRKLAIFRDTVPPPFSFSMRAMRRLRRLTRAGRQTASPAIA